MRHSHLVLFPLDSCQSRPRHCASSRSSFLFRYQPSQTEVVHDILHLFDAVLDPVRPSSEDVVLEIQQLKPSVDIFDELGDLQRSRVVSQGDRIRRQAREFFDGGGQGEKVVFDRDVELIFVFEVDRHCTVTSQSGTRTPDVLLCKNIQNVPPSLCPTCSTVTSCPDRSQSAICMLPMTLCTSFRHRLFHL